MHIKEEYYRKVEEFCERLEIEVPDRNDHVALEKILERMKTIGLI
jgi:DNA replication initiation complex subunit (GINS family)